MKKLLLSVVLALFASSAALAADTYQIDSNHSQVGFTVKHMLISTVSGSFTDFSGTIAFDPQDLPKSSIDVNIKAASLDTRVKMRDDDVRSPNFLDVAKYPEITFKSTSVEKSGDGYVAHGQLTIHGVTKSVDLPFQVTGQTKDPWGKFRIAGEGTLTINRTDYGIVWNKTLDNGGAVVSNEVKIALTIEAVKQ